MIMLFFFAIAFFFAFFTKTKHLIKKDHKIKMYLKKLSI